MSDEKKNGAAKYHIGDGACHACNLELFMLINDKTLAEIKNKKQFRISIKRGPTMYIRPIHIKSGYCYYQ